MTVPKKRESTLYLGLEYPCTYDFLQNDCTQKERIYSILGARVSLYIYHSVEMRVEQSHRHGINCHPSQEHESQALS